MVGKFRKWNIVLDLIPDHYLVSCLVNPSGVRGGVGRYSTKDGPLGRYPLETLRSTHGSDLNFSWESMDLLQGRVYTTEIIKHYYVK